MQIHSLEVIHYPPSGRTANGSSWESLITRSPEWSAIEVAIRRLDRAEFPFLYIHLAEPVEWEQPPHALNVLGGCGEYAITIHLPDDLLSYVDQSRGTEPIDIWVTDQGSTQETRNLCNDIGRVISIAQHFAATGEPSPNAVWE